jgi:HD-like signal output (HDOD) protein
MLPFGLVIVSALGLTGWAYLRWTSEFSAAGGASVSKTDALAGPATGSASAPPIDPERLAQANALASERLWKHGYSTSTKAKSTQRVDDLVRGNVLAILQVDTLDHNFFPRRPTLMTELLRAVDDPDAAPAKIARMIGHDPVLTGDVLRLANSSLYRVSTTPIDTVQRAIAICGIEALRGMLAAAMIRPVFRATSRNFPRFPRALWSRTERAARAAELHALDRSPDLRFESQMVVLVKAIGPLVVYSAIIDVYSRNPMFQANPALCNALTTEQAPRMAARVAKDWEMSPRLVQALERAGGDALTEAMNVGELLGTLSYLESQTVVARDECMELIAHAGLPADSAAAIWETLAVRR